MQTGNDIKYFLTDHLGSTNGLTDASGNITSSASYDSFGNATGNLNTRYQFTGREFDNFTGLHYYRARWYDGNLGRFISEDPIGLSGGINTYGYVGNNPGGGTDPSGLYPGDQATIVAEATRIYQSPEVADFAYMVSSPEGRAVITTGGSAAVGYVAAAAAAAPVATTVGVGVVSIAIAAQIGNYTAGLPGNPFVNGSLNPFGKSAADVENEPWTPKKPRKSCDDEDYPNIFISRSRYPETAAHITDAQNAGYPSIVTIDRLGANARRSQSLAPYPTRPGFDRDEYPAAVFVEGGTGASVRYVNPSDNRGAGSSMRHQMTPYANGRRVRIVVIP